MLWIIALIVAAGFCWLAITIVKYNLELRAVRIVASALPSGQTDEIFRLIEAIGTVPSKGFVGVMRGAPEPNGELKLLLPEGMPEFPWGGMAMDIRAAPKRSELPAEFKIHGQSLEVGEIDVLPIHWIAIPTIEVGKKGRQQGVFSLDRYIRLSPALGRMLGEMYPRDPRALLTQILSVDGLTHSSEPFDQLRSGLAPAWVQTPRFHKCPECHRPMRLILQVPGTLLESRLAEGTFYHFGCPTHPTKTVTDVDWG